VKDKFFFVPFSIASLKHSFHFEDVNFESKTNNWHQYHLAQGNSHLGFALRHHLVFIKDFKAIKLCLNLNNLIVLSKDKESAYATAWEIYQKFQNVINARRKL